MEADVLQLCKTRVTSLGYRIIRASKRQGPFAAAIVDIHTACGAHLIYKQPPVDRLGEVRLVAELGDPLKAWLPEGIRCFSDQPAALLMAHAGEPLLPPHSRTGLSSTARRDALGLVSKKLAELHLQTACVIEDWVREGKAAPYAYSREWAEWSMARIDSLRLLQEPLCSSREQGALMELVGRFYAGYHEGSVRGTRVLTHGDPHWGNILRSQSGGIAFIDWEWCHASTPMRDIAILLVDEPDQSVFEEIAALHVERLLQGGYRASKEDLRHDLEVMLVDNALMSIGWDVELYLRGEQTMGELREVFEIKQERILRFWNRVLR